MPLTPEQIHADHLRKKAADPRNPRTKAGQRLIAMLPPTWWPVTDGTFLEIVQDIEDEAAATERRLTVERVRDQLNIYPDTPANHDRDVGLIEWVLDKVATADVDEEIAEANREMEADLWNSDR